MIELMLLRMKAMTLGHTAELVEERRAWWFKTTRSDKIIFPGQKYVRVRRYFPVLGDEPSASLSLDENFTPEEYTLHLLKGD